MTVDRNRLKDIDWNAGENGQAPTWERVQVAILMDLRDELKAIRRAMEQMNGTLQCPNFLAIPTILKSIRRNTTKPKETK